MNKKLVRSVSHVQLKKVGFEEFIMKEENIDNLTWSYAVCGSKENNLLMIMCNFEADDIKQSLK